MRIPTESSHGYLGTSQKIHNHSWILKFNACQKNLLIEEAANPELTTT